MAYFILPSLKSCFSFSHTKDTAQTPTCKRPQSNTFVKVILKNGAGIVIVFKAKIPIYNSFW